MLVVLVVLDEFADVDELMLESAAEEVILELLTPLVCVPEISLPSEMIG